MDNSDDLTQRARVDAALWNIRIDAATGEVIQALQARDVASIVLKGPALSVWYSDSQARSYVDGDIWVAPQHLPVAEETLRSLGFEPTVDESGLPDWWLEHASGWSRDRDRGSIDLHRKLQGTRVSPQVAWDLLWPGTLPLAVGGVDARRLSDPALAMYVALHAAHHGVDHGGGQKHLDAALERVEIGVWQAASDLAAQLGAVDALAAGLGLSATGRRVAAELRLPAPSTVRVALKASSPPPIALGFEQLASGSAGSRLKIIARKLFPPPGFIRHWWPPASESQRMLVLGYLYRPLWLARHAPAGWRAWRAARREVGDRGQI